MKQKIAVIIGIVGMALTLAACSSGNQTLGSDYKHPLPTPTTKAPVHIGPTAYQPNSPTTITYYYKGQDYSYNVVPGVNPNVPDKSRLENFLSNTSWQDNYAVYTVINGTLTDDPNVVGNVITETCSEGIPTPNWPNYTLFHTEATQGPVIPKGQLVRQAVKVNGKTEYKWLPSTGTQHEPGPVYPIEFTYKLVHGKWQERALNVGVNLSCGNPS
jgi:hypothetical protein